VARVPIVRVGATLIATVQDQLCDSDVMLLQEELSATLERTGVHAVLLDLTTVQTVDSFLGRLLNDVAAEMRLLGAQTVIVGIQPAVAITLVELGLNLKGVTTALDVDKGMRRLQHSSRVHDLGRM
jgi:rsbT antagonist protein RsbS